MGVRLLPSAVQRLKILEEKEQAACLRLQENSGGCSGFQYEFSLEEEEGDDDLVFEQDGAVLLVERLSMDFLDGCEIDYEDTMIRAGFKVCKNDLADASCGCGSSFNVANFRQWLGLCSSHFFCHHLEVAILRQTRFW